MSKKFYKTLAFTLLVLITGLMTTSCGGDDKDGLSGSASSIVGTWVDGDKTMTLGKDGSYYSTTAFMSQYRRGTYSYNPNNSLMTINVQAVTGMNGAYQQTLIVQSLTSSTLVLLYTDGDVEGYYTRK